LNVVTSLVAL